MPKNQLRAAEEKDAAAIASLCVELGYPTDPQSTTRRLISLSRLTGHAVFVAEDPRGDVVGWVHVFAAHRVESPAFGEIGGLVVAERRRGEGVGRALVHAAEVWAGEEGLSRIRVRSNVLREGAYGFYSHLGYATVKDQAVFDKQLGSRP